jgi:YesN/AraC family two-component response regulator
VRGLINILLAEDDIEMLQGLTRFIDWEFYGFRIIRAAKNGHEACKLFAELLPEVIITDISMPVMSGLELIREAKKLRPDVKCVIISCHEEFEYAREAVRLHADEYLLKHTLTETELIQTINKIKQNIASNLAIISNETPPITSNPDIMKAVKYIEHHLGGSINQKTLSVHINMNPSYFSRLFKRETGMSFSDFVLQKRIQKATDLLVNTTICVEEIVRAVGIESVSYFYRIYKQLTGSTPGDTRNKAKRG